MKWPPELGERILCPFRRGDSPLYLPITVQGVPADDTRDILAHRWNRVQLDDADDTGSIRAIISVPESLSGLTLHVPPGWRFRESVPK